MGGMGEFGVGSGGRNHPDPPVALRLGCPSNASSVFLLQATGQEPDQLHRGWGFPCPAGAGGPVSAQRPAGASSPQAPCGVRVSPGAPLSLRCCRDILSVPSLPGPEEGLSRGLVPLLRSCAPRPDPAPGCPPACSWLWRGEAWKRQQALPGVWAVPIPCLSVHPPCAGGWVGAVASRGLVPPGPSHAPTYGLAALTCPPLPSRRTLNNNNITSIPVSSFNHMPKLRTL